MSPDEVDTDDRELHSSQEESPLEAAAIQGPIRAGPDYCVDERCGSMLKAAPVSTRKRLFDNWSVT